MITFSVDIKKKDGVKSFHNDECKWQNGEEKTWKMAIENCNMSAK